MAANERRRTQAKSAPNDQRAPAARNSVKKVAPPQRVAMPHYLAYSAAASRQSMRKDLEKLILRRNMVTSECRQREDRITNEVLSKSKAMEQLNFESIALADLVRMADLYDQYFFDGLCLGMARSDGLTFRWSKRMTSAGGKTTRYYRPASILSPAMTRYEITLSSSLLFQTFRNSSSEALVCGRVCHDRLRAMQRIVEHELIHLSEMLVWTDSNCAARRFQSIANRLFAHTEHKHELITQQERAKQEFNIRVGSTVSFVYEGKSYVGLVNRITRRATVLVEDPRGTQYSDGKKYSKFYMPLSMLRPVAAF